MGMGVWMSVFQGLVLLFEVSMWWLMWTRRACVRALRCGGVVVIEQDSDRVVYGNEMVWY